MVKKAQEYIKNNQDSDNNFSDTDMLAQSLGGIIDTPALTSSLSGKQYPLVRRDLLQYEDVLCHDLANFIEFKTHALYFPTQDELETVQYLEDEKKLLLPLRRDDALLGIMLLRHVSLEKRLLPFLPALAQICLDKIYNIKMSGLDERCNLMRSQRFMMKVHREIHGITQFYAQSFARSAARSASNSAKSLGETKTHTIEKHTTVTVDNAHIFNDLGDIHSELTEHSYEGQIDRQSSVGLMVLPVLGLDYVRKFYGFSVAEQLFVSFSQKIKEIIPEDALCTILDGDRFAVLFPGATRRMLENLASQCVVLEEKMQVVASSSMLASMENLSDFVEAKLCAGYALFPQDWDGAANSRDSAEIPHLLLHKASIAADRLKNMPSRKGISAEKEAFHIAGRSLAFRQILLQGGNIEEVLPYSQVRVKLGSEDGAQENMCFSVWADAERSRYKGEILLRKVGENHSEAEILMLSDPGKSLEEGDFLQYIPQSRSQSEVLNEDGALFYAYRDFMNMVNGQISAQNVKKFSLVLMRFQWEKKSNANEQVFTYKKNSDSEKELDSGKKLDFAQYAEFNKKNTNAKNVDSENSSAKDLVNANLVNANSSNTMNAAYTIDVANADDTSSKKARHDFTMKDIAQKLDIYLKEYNKENSVELASPVIGSMSFNSLIMYHPQMDGEHVKTLYEKIGAMVEDQFNVPCAIGIAPYPFLNFRPADMWDACRKALDYAMLLPLPHVGIFDSLAINISADRKFSQGDIFGAVEEYRTAILADGDNILAWNSLGICLAELGRYAEARNAFEVAYARQSQDAATCYNLGTVSLALEDREKAKEYFLACLAQDKTHLFARIRLGEIAEKELEYGVALEQYTKASLDNPESSVPYRCLARLHTLQNQKERARELLQLALQKNAEDAVSLQFLAGLYLDGGEDAELAEVLARQSVAILPWRRSAWAELARALEAQGRFPEAAEVRRNSMRL